VAERLGNHTYYATLAKAMLAIGQTEDAARTLDFVFQMGPQRWVLPELLRLRAATERAFGRDSDAEATLRESLKVADEIACLAWKLRSAFDLATMLKAQARWSRRAGFSYRCTNSSLMDSIPAT
jgi:hypothetical protein